MEIAGNNPLVSTALSDNERDAKRDATTAINGSGQTRREAVDSAVKESVNALAQEKAKEQALSTKDMQEMVDKLNESQELSSRNLSFNVDQEAGRTVIKVLDSESGDVIRQIPSEELVELAKRMQEQTESGSESNSGVLLDSRV
jgi:flagellar protein FlaG